MFGIIDYLKMGAGLVGGLMLYHLYAVSIGYPSAARQARAGYVLVAEKSAAEAQADVRDCRDNSAVMHAQKVSASRGKKHVGAQTEQGSHERRPVTDLPVQQ
ncbi:hypothetical protein [Rhizobium leguminosarum]|uniref:hypothetical protein n=1 Tax=Rhizobium leguminosarum TaxID=384 RepID=UPI0021BBD54B|nr:hypothetical protein [Rhizobium leguminosarum]